jgi:hypothetical protein
LKSPYSFIHGGWDCQEKKSWIKNHLAADYKVLDLDEVKKNIYYTWFSAKECKIYTLFFYVVNEAAWNLLFKNGR